KLPNEPSPCLSRPVSACHSLSPPVPNYHFYHRFNPYIYCRAASCPGQGPSDGPRGPSGGGLGQRFEIGLHKAGAGGVRQEGFAPVIPEQEGVPALQQIRVAGAERGERGGMAVLREAGVDEAEEGLRDRFVIGDRL